MTTPPRTAHDRSSHVPPQLHAPGRPAGLAAWSTLLCLAAVLFGPGCGNHPGETPSPQVLPAATVRVQTVQTTSQPDAQEITGTIRSKVRANIEAKITGRITSLPVVAGTILQPGDLIAQIAVEEIQARLDQASARRDLAELELARLTELLSKNAATQREFDEVQSQARVARAAVAEMDALIDNAKVTAPFAAVVTRKLADQGDLATPGKPLVELQDPAALRVEAGVPESLIPNLDLGAQLPVHLPSATTAITATITEIAPAASPGSRTFLVKLDLPKNAAARPGQFARVAVPSGTRSVLQVPATAVIQRGQMELVFVETGNQASLRIVKTGPASADVVELLSGVVAGERIVVEGADQLRDGQPLEIRP